MEEKGRRREHEGGEGGREGGREGERRGRK
jgi:hypothetical protein